MIHGWKFSRLFLNYHIEIMHRLRHIQLQGTLNILYLSFNLDMHEKISKQVGTNVLTQSGNVLGTTLRCLHQSWRSHTSSFVIFALVLHTANIHILCIKVMLCGGIYWVFSAQLWLFLLASSRQRWKKARTTKKNNI